MTPQKLVSFFKNSKAEAARNCHVTEKTIYNWIDQGFIPYRKQKLIERLTAGELKASKEKMD